MRCEQVRELLSLMVYDELPADQLETVQGHVQQCEMCAHELEQLRTVQKQLQQWRGIEANEPVGVVLDNAAVEALPMVTTVNQKAGRRRWMPWLVGAAAGLMLAITVMAVGASVRSGDGQFTISFGRAVTGEVNNSGNDERELTDAQIDVLRTLFIEQSDRQAAFALDLVDERFRELEGTQDDRFLALVHTIRAMREEDMQLFEQALTAVALDSREQTQRTREALNDVVRTVALRPMFDPNYQRQNDTKEFIP